MTDFSQYRSAAIDTFLTGDPDRLASQIRNNDLNELERNFLAEFVQANAPKGPRGPKRKSLNPVRAALIRFWRAREGWEKDGAILNDIATALAVSETMVRKYLRQIDNPKTDGEKLATGMARIAIWRREWAIEADDTELINLYRNADLKPISA